MKERKAYGVDLVISKNYEKLMSDEFPAKLKSLPGFLGVTEYKDSQAALFDSQSNRNKALRELSSEIYCEIILETAHIPV